jgi:hypothetical protein
MENEQPEVYSDVPATKVLLDALENADDFEDVIVIYNTKSGDINYSSSSSYISRSLGLIRSVEVLIEKRLRD